MLERWQSGLMHLSWKQEWGNPPWVRISPSPHMKYLGIDYGTKRIGIAISDDTGTLAFPLTTVFANPQALQTIHALLKENRIEKIIIGESRNFRGEKMRWWKTLSNLKKI